MILASKDKYLKEIADSANEIEHIKIIKNPKDLHLYGISAERGIDYVIPDQLINSRKFVDSLGQVMDRSIRIACYWGQEKTYNFNCLGLGLAIREGRKEECLKMIVTLYLWINDKIDQGPKKKGKRLADLAPMIDELRRDGGRVPDFRAPTVDRELRRHATLGGGVIGNGGGGGGVQMPRAGRRTMAGLDLGAAPMPTLQFNDPRNAPTMPTWADVAGTARMITEDPN